MLIVVIAYLPLASIIGLVYQQQHKRHTQNKVHHQKVQLRFSKNDKVLLVDAGKEIILNGEYYDIISKSVVGDEVIYLCYHDKHEKFLTQLISTFTSGISNPIDSHSKHNGFKFQLLKDFIPLQHQLIFFNLDVAKFNPTNHGCFLNVNPDKATPPPKYLV